MNTQDFKVQTLFLMHKLLRISQEIKNALLSAKPETEVEARVLDNCNRDDLSLSDFIDLTLSRRTQITSNFDDILSSLDNNQVDDESRLEEDRPALLSRIYDVRNFFLETRTQIKSIAHIILGSSLNEDEMAECDDLVTAFMAITDIGNDCLSALVPIVDFVLPSNKEGEFINE